VTKFVCNSEASESGTLYVRRVHYAKGIANAKQKASDTGISGQFGFHSDIVSFGDFYGTDGRGCEAMFLDNPLSLLLGGNPL